MNLEEDALTSEKCSAPGRIGKRAVTWDGFSTLERSMQSCERIFAGMRQAVGDKLRDGMTPLDLLFIMSAVSFVGSCCASTNLLNAKNNRAVMPPFNWCSS